CDRSPGGAARSRRCGAPASGPWSGGRRSAAPALLHARRLAPELTQEVELRTAHAGRPHDFDLLDDRRVQREDALDPLPERDLAHGERRTRAATMLADDDPLEDLDALLVTFADLHVHPHGVPRPHLRTLDELGPLDSFNRVHDRLLLSPAAIPRTRPAPRRRAAHAPA